MPYTDISLRLTGRTFLPVLPNHIDIDLTNVCNQDCFYCNSADFRAKYLVSGSKNDYLDLLDKLASWRKHTPKSIGSIRPVSYYYHNFIYSSRPDANNNKFYCGSE